MVNGFLGRFFSSSGSIAPGLGIFFHAPIVVVLSILLGCRLVAI